MGHTTDMIAVKIATINKKLIRIILNSQNIKSIQIFANHACSEATSDIDPSKFNVSIEYYCRRTDKTRLQIDNHSAQIRNVLVYKITWTLSFFIKSKWIVGKTK